MVPTVLECHTLAAVLNANCLWSQNAARHGFQLGKKENQYGSPVPHSLCWGKGSSGPDGLQLGAGQDA